jgi:hypothetical protein
MPSNPTSSTNPAFNTPQPRDLQSEDNQAAVEKRLSETQGGETEVVDDRPSEERTDSERTGEPFQLDEMDHLADRHLPTLDSPPG